MTKNVKENLVNVIDTATGEMLSDLAGLIYEHDLAKLPTPPKIIGYSVHHGVLHLSLTCGDFTLRYAFKDTGLYCQVIKSKSDFTGKPVVIAGGRTHFDISPSDFVEDFSSNLSNSAIKSLIHVLQKRINIAVAKAKLNL